MNRHIKALDGLRAFAVSLVMLYHLGTYKLGGLTIEFGWVGVQLFFVLSGFLITQILLNDRDQALGDYLKRFYWRRSLRIFPLYFFYLLLVTAMFLASRQPVKFVEQAPFLFTYTYNFSSLTDAWYHSAFLTHLWSLSVEEQFYLLWPFLIYFLPHAWLRVLVVGLILAGPLFRWWLEHLLGPGTMPETLYWFTLTHLDAFATGAAMVLFGRYFLRQVGQWMWLSILVALGTGLANGWLWPGTIDWTSLGYPIAQLHNGQHLWSYSLLNIASAFIILWATQLPEGHWLASRPLVAIGKVSYGMYVYHWAILAIVVRAYQALGGENYGPVGALAMFAGYFGVLYGVSYLSFQWFEARFIRLKDQFFRKVTAR
jgi:peptidoglycan/LPS O-acetylase OafA/YrhL